AVFGRVEARYKRGILGLVKVKLSVVVAYAYFVILEEFLRESNAESYRSNRFLSVCVHLEYASVAVCNGLQSKHYVRVAHVCPHSSVVRFNQSGRVHEIVVNIVVSVYVNRKPVFEDRFITHFKRFYLFWFYQGCALNHKVVRVL